MAATIVLFALDGGKILPKELIGALFRLYRDGTSGKPPVEFADEIRE